MIAETPQEKSITGASSGQRLEAFPVLAALATAAGIRLLVAWASGPAAPQEIRYIQVAMGLFDGSAFEATGHRFPAIIQPPFYPALLALGSWLMPSALAVARGVSILAGTLTVLPVILLTRRIIDVRAAHRAGFIMAVYPILCHISGIAMTEPTFGLLVAWAALIFHRAGEAEKGFHLPLAGGLLLGLAFLTRPEGLAYMGAGILALFLALWISHRRAFREAAIAPALALAGFLVLAVPYGVWLKQMTGRWMLAPKAVMTQAHNSIMAEGVKAGWKEPYGTRLFYERVKFGLNDEGTDLAASEALRGLGLLPDEPGAASRPLGLGEVVDSSQLVFLVARNLKLLYVETLKYGLILPSFLIAFLGLGVTARPWSRGAPRRGHLFILIWLLAGGSWLISHVQPRFLYPSVAFLAPWMAAGWVRIEDWLALSFLKIEPGSAPFRGRLLAALMAGAVAAGSLIHAIPPTREYGSTWREHAEAGRRLKEMGIRKGTIMALTPGVAFYSGLRFEVMPYASVEDLIRYARIKRADFLVASMVEFPSYRPQYLELFDTAYDRTDLKPVLVIDDDPRHAVIVFEVLPASDPDRPAVAGAAHSPSPDPVGGTAPASGGGEGTEP